MRVLFAHPLVRSAVFRALDPSVFVPRDLAGLRAEENLLRYPAVDKVVVRATASTTPDELRVVGEATRLTGVQTEIVEWREFDDVLAARIGATGATRLRALGPISDVLARACHRAGIVVDDTAVTASSTVELGRWCHEQAISRTLHRHGRIADAS